MIRPLLTKRRRSAALQLMILELTSQQNAQPVNYLTIDGELVGHKLAETALHNGTAIMVGGLLVGAIGSYDC